MTAPAPTPPPPASPAVARPGLYRRLTGSVPLLVSVVLHAVLILGAGFWVVSETLVGRKKTFEAPPAVESAAQRQIEHRVQVARRSGGAAASPLSAQRIFSAGAHALQLPPPTDLPSPGVGAFGAGFGGAGSGLGATSGGSFATGGSGVGALGGRGFMSLSFLGLTNQRVQRVVFVVDVGRDLLDIRKGGFRAFEILREKIMQFVGQLPPSAEFGVVVFDQSVARYRAELVPATAREKEAFFAWMGRINADADRPGLRSAAGAVPWAGQAPASAGVDPELMPTGWAQAVHAALQLRPDTVYVITGDFGRSQRRIGGAELARRQRDSDDRASDLQRDGIDPAAVERARREFLERSRRRLDEINAELRAARRDPLIVTSTRRIFAEDFQRELARLGYSLPLDATGWSDKQGRPIWSIATNDREAVDARDLGTHLAKLQRAYLKEPARVNFFLFSGPDENPTSAIENFTRLAKANGGRFERLTAQRLEELAKE